MKHTLILYLVRKIKRKNIFIENKIQKWINTGFKLKEEMAPFLKSSWLTL